jgi:hypothetical protein
MMETSGYMLETPRILGYCLLAVTILQVRSISREDRAIGTLNDYTPDPRPSGVMI